MKIRKPIQQGTALVPCRTKRENSFKKIGSIARKVLLALLLILLLLAVFGTAAHAAGLVDDTVDAANEYSKYPLDNYQLDFYVDSGWDWLPWNWLDGIGKQVMYGLYAITNFIWTISLYLSNATGYLIQEAYSLDFISSTADSIGKNMQTLAGVTTGGLSSEGFYIGFLLILILVVGIYVAYTGLIKRETTKAIHAVVNFVVVFVLSAAFIAYAPDYIGKINEFSADISNASLTLGTKIVLPNSESQGKDSVDLIRNSLFSILPVIAIECLSKKGYIFSIILSFIYASASFAIVFAMSNVLSPLSAVFRWALPHMTTGPTYGLDDWFLSSPACIGILILTAIASLMLAIIYKSKQEI